MDFRANNETRPFDADSEGMNISEAFKEILDEDFDVDFAHSATFPDAPNPCLIVEGLGGIGLPLSTRDANAIKLVATQGPQTGAWELEPRQIEIENTSWTAWVTSVPLHSLQRALDGTFGSAGARCELAGLTLRDGPGSSQIPVGFQEGNRVADPRQFGTLVITLSSRSSGGKVQVTHEGQTKIFDLSQPSGSSPTSAMGWYSELNPVFYPVEEGYLLYLTYKLVCTDGSPIPCLADVSSADRELRDLCESWRIWLDLRALGIGDENITVPLFVGHFIYPPARELTENTLSPSYRSMLTHLKRYADVFGLNLFFAEFENVKKGSVEIPARNYKMYGYDSDSDVDPDDLDMVDPWSDETSIEMSALEGGSLGLSVEAEAYLEGLITSALKDEWYTILDDADYEAEYSEEDRMIYSRFGTLTHTYAHTALIISAKPSDGGRFSIFHIVKELQSAILNNGTPSEKERKLGEVLLLLCGRLGAGDLKRWAIHALSEAGHRWKDKDFLARIHNAAAVNA